MPEFAPLTTSFGTIVTRAGQETLLDLNPDQVIERFRESGVLLFRGFEIDDDLFQGFTERFSTEFTAHGIENRPRLKEGDGRTVMANIGHFPLRLHNEMSYFPQRPDLLWLYCVRPAAADGETTLVESVDLLSRLGPEQREPLERQRLLYAYPVPNDSNYFSEHGPEAIAERLPPGDSFEFEVVSTDALLDRLAPFYGERVAGNLRPVLEQRAATSPLADRKEMVLIKYLTPAIRKTRYGGRESFANSALQFTPNEKFHAFIYFEDGSSIPRSLIGGIQSIADEMTFLVPWQASDLAMVDNSRFLHGRRAFEDDRRELHVRMALASF